MSDNSHSVVLDVFSEFQDYMAAEQAIRESVRLAVLDLEQKARAIHFVLQSVHQINGLSSVEKICSDCRGKFAEVEQLTALLASKVSNEYYYRFSDHWRFVMQKLCFLAAFIVYLETDKLISREACAAMIGVKTRRQDGFHLDLEDYLMGLLQLASELSRLSVNAVTFGDYNRPVRIAQFIGELDTGFRLLNLKNDSLRKRFDALKYDLKKVEEVVYDITIRGLATRDVGSGGGGGSNADMATA